MAHHVIKWLTQLQAVAIHYEVLQFTQRQLPCCNSGECQLLASGKKQAPSATQAPRCPRLTQAVGYYYLKTSNSQIYVGARAHLRHPCERPAPALDSNRHITFLPRSSNTSVLIRCSFT